MIEPEITPDTRKWIEWYIHYLKEKRIQYVDIVFGELEFLDMRRGSGIISYIEDEIALLEFKLYLLDNPHHGDTGNKHEWE